MNRIIKDSTHYLELLITGRSGDSATGLSISYKVEKSSDNSLIESGNLVEIGSGIYQKAIVFSNTGQYRVVYTTPPSYSNVIENILVIENEYELLLRILGLSQENYRIFNPTYDGNDNMLSATLKTYPTASDCENDTNPIAAYEVTATYSSTNMTSYKVKKV